MTSRFFPETLFELGFTDLVSVIPPGAQLTPSSKIPQNAVGKIPGRRLGNGLWAGYDWRNHRATVEDVRAWTIAGANVGTRADHFPGVDIDSTDPRLVQIIEEAAVGKLGPAPVRIGRAPKRLLMYRTDEPFSRMRLWIKAATGENHLVEILGQGQQYLVHGTHPTTLRPYEWLTNPADLGVDGLTPITREKASEFLDEVASLVEMLGYGSVEREGDGRPITRAAAGNQQALLAPSIERLREAVELIPNTNTLFPARSDYLRMAYAIRAAAGDEHEDEAFEIFATWAARWPGNDRSPGNHPDVVRADWRRVHGPYAVGWSYLAELARGYGFNDAVDDFEALQDKPDAETPEAPRYSDQWLADRVVQRTRGTLRFVPQEGKWLVWTGSRWLRDAELLAEDTIKLELRALADREIRRGTTDEEKKKALGHATRICSAGKATAIAQLARSDRSIAVSMDALDHDPWLLNTPAGVVDLRSGAVLPSDPDALSTKVTTVAPDFHADMPEWKRFLREATGGDAELEAYLQRLVGYALTGSTREQQLTFIWGDGGNGKGVFIHTISGILGDYAVTASMDTFTASFGDKHTTDLAMLVGARLVTANETQAGKRWDEARLKALTGGDPITARFMRQDNFTFKPQFKLIFTGNHKPEIRDVDRAMQRRIQMVPFTVTPVRVDPELESKLRMEWPAILAWAIEGCLAWQRDGLQPPERVRLSTQEYFEDEDAVGRWLREATERDDEGRVTTRELFDNWREWANANGEYVGSVKRLASKLITRKFPRWQDPQTRRMGFSGLKLKDRQDFEALV